MNFITARPTPGGRRRCAPASPAPGSLSSTPPQAASYEWAGVFDLTPGHKYAWIAQKTDGKYVDDSMELFIKEVAANTEEAVHANDDARVADYGDYADPAMKIVVMEVTPASESEADLGAALEGAEADATTALEAASCATVAAGGSVALETCQKLTFNNNTVETTFTMAADGYVAIFAEHVPIEFEHNKHYLQDSNDVDVEPLFEEGGGGGHSHGHRRLSGADGHRRLNTCATVNSGDSIAFDTCNKLVFDTNLYTSTYLLEVPAGGSGKYGERKQCTVRAEEAVVLNACFPS